MSNVGNKISAVFMTLMVVALCTTLVLPGRQTPAAIKAFFDGMSSVTRAAIGIQ